MSKRKSSGYVPPFTVSSRAISLVAEISAQIERYAIRMEQADGLRLRKANKIRTIHSSLAIEGNSLSENQVHDISSCSTSHARTRTYGGFVSLAEACARPSSYTQLCISL